MPVQNVKQPSEPKGIVANKCNFGVVTPSEKKANWTDNFQYMKCIFQHFVLDILNKHI